jgi:hypothetical protein
LHIGKREYARKVEEELDGRDMRQVRRRREVHKGIWWENLRERGHLEDVVADRMIIVKWFFRKWDGHGLD